MFQRLDWERNKNRSPRTRLQYDKLNEDYRKRIAVVHAQEDFLMFMNNNVPAWVALTQRDSSPQIEASNYISRWGDKDMWIDVYGVPWDVFVEHILGPIHRAFGLIKPKMSIGSGGFIEFNTKILMNGDITHMELRFKMVGAIAKCEIIEIEEKYIPGHIRKVYKVRCEEEV